MGPDGAPGQVRFQAASDRPLETSRLRLEPLVVGHAAKLFNSFQDEALRFVGRPNSVGELEERYRRFATHGPNDGTQVWLNWAAREKKTRTYVGWFQATLHGRATTNLSYVVFPAHWRNGYATEACQAMMVHLREIYAPALFIVEMDRKNGASIALAEKLGFTRVLKSEPGEFRYELPAQVGAC